MLPGQIFGVIGALFILIGIFAPLVSVPVWGSISLYALSKPVALALLAVTAAHLVFCIRRWWWGMWISKPALALALLYAVYQNWDRITGRHSFVGMLLQQVTKIHWGVGLLAAGIAIVFAASLPREKSIPPLPVPPAPLP